METDDYKKLVRLYLPQDFAAGAAVPLAEGQAHYLRNVMRKGAGDRLRVFNGRDGDWLAALDAVGKRGASVVLERQIAPQRAGSDLWVIAAAVKKEALDLMVEKASELGAARFIPVTSDHAVVHKINRERLEAIAIEAAEQCERGDVMEVDPLSGLLPCLAALPANRQVLFCLERAEAPPLVATLRNIANKPLTVLVGPEGGFSAGEISTILEKNKANVHPVSLGPRILRAETALIAALAGVQLMAEDEDLLPTISIVSERPTDNPVEERDEG